MGDLRNELRARVTWPDDPVGLTLQAQAGEDADALEKRARKAGNQRNGIRSRGTPTAFTVKVQYRTVTSWKTYEEKP